MPIANEEKTGRYPWGTEVNNEPVKICGPEEVMPMIERLQMLGRQAAIMLKILITTEEPGAPMTLLMPLRVSLIFP